MFLGKKEFKELTDQKNTIFERIWFWTKEFFYTFKYVFDYVYSFFTKRYYSAIIKINNYWYYLPDLDDPDDMHYTRTLHDLEAVIANSSVLVVLKGYEVQEFCVFIFKEDSEGYLNVQRALVDNNDEYPDNDMSRKAIPLTSLVDLNYSLN
jgi:hypothetical protein